ncbi:hypothetical protein MNBD_GAMMA13-1616 [hydrothermal vent metagenome]|uniref:HTH crp-type domain-containing protein n=1 Tax=hydrothermal vent metagenome TaxID=652676 RepID=A0A3B0Z449_9ZZZZ
MPLECTPPDQVAANNHADARGVDNTLKLLAVSYPDFIAASDPQALALLHKAELVSLPADTILFHENDPCHNFVWLIEGSVRVYKHSADGREMTLYRVEPGELCILNLNALLGGRVYPAEARSESSVTGLVLTGEDFLEGVATSGSFRSYVMKIQADRLYEVIGLVSDIAFHQLDLRLACLLGQRFERSHGEPINITHAQLAGELGTTREVISRILKEFQNQRCVSLSRGRIRLESQQGLDWFIRGS